MELNVEINEEYLTKLLQERYTAIRRGSNADRYVRARQVRYPNPRYHARSLSTVDYLVFDTYKNSKKNLHGELLGFEIKTSRADFLNELKNPMKAERWRQLCDRWFLVAPDESILKNDLPEGWGLMVIGDRGKLRIAKSAQRIDPVGMPKSVLGSYLRAVAQTAVWEQENSKKS